jgi:hypothetical protein
MFVYAGTTSSPYCPIPLPIPLPLLSVRPEQSLLLIQSYPLMRSGCLIAWIDDMYVFLVFFHRSSDWSLTLTLLLIGARDQMPWYGRFIILVQQGRGHNCPQLSTIVHNCVLSCVFKPGSLLLFHKHALSLHFPHQLSFTEPGFFWDLLIKSRFYSFWILEVISYK